MQPSVAVKNELIQDATLVALAGAGHSTRQIEAILGNLDHSTIARRLKSLTPRKATEIYKMLRADILSEKQRKLLLRSDRADPRSQADLAKAFGIYYDKERLERGQSTANQAVSHGVTEELAELIGTITGRPNQRDSNH